MRLPQNILTQTYTKPRIFLCEADKTKICQLETTNTSGTFKFNAYSELSFEVSRLYNDLITGENHVHPYYDKIEALRLILLEGFGYFEIQTPVLSSDGIKEIKTITAYSSEYTLTQKYLEDFYINTGEIDSREVLYATTKYGQANADTVKPVVFYDQSNKSLSLLHLVFDNIYGWEIGHVDDSLKTLSRTFEIDRQSVYDLLMNEVCEKFNCYIVFDTINNKVNFYAEALTQKFMGDGSTKLFTLNPAFEALGTVSVNGSKNTRYKYDPAIGVIQLDKAPDNRAILEITDGALSRWETDVFVTFDNLSQEINITYDADEIKTKLTVTGADELDIREVNMGQPYIVDLSYYCTPDWLGPDLYEAYTDYLKLYTSKEGEYTEYANKINKIGDDILWEENRMSLEEECVAAVQLDKENLPPGKYFIRKGSSPNFYYTEVTLPGDYNVEHVYYKFTTDINVVEEKVSHLYEALQAYFKAYFKDKKANISATLGDNTSSLDSLKLDFSFVKDASNNLLYDKMLESLKNVSTDENRIISASQMAAKDSEGNLKYKVESTKDTEFIFASVNRFLNTMWNQLGSYPLRYCYRDTYTKLQTTAVEASWGDSGSDEYGKYFAVYLMVKSIDRAIAARESTIAALNNSKQEWIDKNAQITKELDLYNYFDSHPQYSSQRDQFMMRLNAFFREDEYIDDNFVYTGQESLAELYQLKRELKECGKIELNKLCQPRLQFSMSMANIYALPEFEPIIDQFQLGNVIKVALRPDYLKQSRLLQVNINFDDFSDFSCEFGDLTSLQTQSDLHADLLAQAISAGKSVASSKSHWDKGVDTANSVDLRIQRGLLDAATSIKSMDGTQGVEISNYGIRLQKTDENGNLDPEEGWITNNKFLYSDDNFQTVQSVYGKFVIDDEEYFGVLAKTVIAGYIEGSKIRGADLKAGYLGKDENGNDQWMFEADENGNVYMCNRTVEFSYDKNSLKETADDLASRLEGVHEIVQGQIDDINSTKMYRVEISTQDSQIFREAGQKATLACKVYSWDKDITDRKLTDDGYPENVLYVSKTYASYARWIRISNDANSDATWNRNDDGTYRHIGKILEIGPEDVVHNASFYCEVDIPDKPESEPTPEPDPEDTNKTT